MKFFFFIFFFLFFFFFIERISALVLIYHFLLWLDSLIPTKRRKKERKKEREKERKKKRKTINRREMNRSGDHVTIEFDRSEFMNK